MFWRNADAWTAIDHTGGLGGRAGARFRSKKRRMVTAARPAAYTLQVITVSSAVQVAKLLDQHDHPERFASFRIQGKEQLLFVLTYGVFDRVEGAEQAREEVANALAMPAEQLWVRRLSAVQRSIRTTLQL